MTSNSPDRYSALRQDRTRVAVLDAAGRCLRGEVESIGILRNPIADEPR